MNLVGAVHTNVASSWVNLTPPIQASSGFLVPMMFSSVKEELVNEESVNDELLKEEPVIEEVVTEESVIEEVVTEEQVWLCTLLFVACWRSHIQHTEMLVHRMKMKSRCFTHVQTPRVHHVPHEQPMNN